MIIAERILSYEISGGNLPVQITMFAPEHDESSWLCKYTIDWPSGVRSGFAAGFDAVQALHLTLQKIGIDLYMSEYHASGRLSWGEKGAGYGFPVPGNARDVLIGDDLNFEG
ncbi:DUF6968 family protein [Methylobacterium goesingense]|uniref:DUF6968 domain-containing protein n=1 Tax=Methylobacterium goesingense TaxID=243690 RepID=A0ABV2L5W5_9HYPH|nr:hypothetical protein [Methylobacterium goesingense]GJD75313.1 hypothetical protein CFIICLFH_3554 [Methylobacterium goesingense]